MLTEERLATPEPRSEPPSIAAARKRNLIPVGLGLLALGFVYALVAGTEKMTVRLGSEIKNPSLAQVAAALAIFAVIIGTPVALLMTQRAKREFSSPPATC